MSTHLLLFKDKEDEGTVIYFFGPNKNQLGKIEFNKKTKAFSNLIPVPNMDDSWSDHYLKYAAKRIVKCDIDGDFPEETFFMS